MCRKIFSRQHNRNQSRWSLMNFEVVLHRTCRALDVREVPYPPNRTAFCVRNEEIICLTVPQSEPDNVPALIDGRCQRNGSNKQKRYTIAYFMRCAGNFPISRNSIVQICILPANGRPSRRRASEKLKFAIYCVWVFERVAVNGKRGDFGRRCVNSDPLGDVNNQLIWKTAVEYVINSRT